MPSETQSQVAFVSKKLLWAGWIASALPVLMLIVSGVMKLVKPAPLVEGFARFGYSDSLALGIGIVELACTVIYLIPRSLRTWCDLADGVSGRCNRDARAHRGSLLRPDRSRRAGLGRAALREERLCALLPLRS